MPSYAGPRAPSFRRARRSSTSSGTAPPGGRTGGRRAPPSSSEPEQSPDSPHAAVRSFLFATHQTLGGQVADTIPRRGALEPLSEVVIRIAGDSGDGMQLTGDRFTTSSALLGNDLSTLPDFPAEIRAPAGTVHGVSAFQVHIADHDISTPGDSSDVLVVMNPAA